MTHIFVITNLGPLLRFPAVPARIQYSIWFGQHFSGFSRVSIHWLSIRFFRFFDLSPEPRRANRDVFKFIFPQI